MSRKFRVTIGGVTYNVEVEEVGAAATSAPTYQPAPAASPAPPAARPAPALPPTAPTAPATKAEPAGEGTVVRAPLPGMVVGVKVTVGQKVSPGDVLLVLEAMKMENDITATEGGTVKEVLVSKGTGVSLGDSLIVIA